MTIQTLHLRSSVQGKEPVAGSATGQLPVGSIGINFNSAEPFLTIQDSAGNIRRIAGIKVDAAAPATPTAGEAWLDTTIATKPVFKVYDGAAWQGAGSSTSTGGIAPASPTQGDLWVDTSVSGSPVLKVYNGTSFVAITPDATTSAKGVVQLADAAAVTAGTTGRVVTADQLKVTNDALATATAGGLSNVTGTAPITVSGTGATRAIAVTAATASAAGVVQLADAAAVTAGTAGRVVDASQLKSTNDALATAQTNITNLQAATADATTTVKGIVQLADAAAITAGTAGRVVTADQLKTTNDGLSTATTNITALQAKTADASETVKGIVELATTAEVLTGTDTVRAVTPKGLKDHYIAKNISTLPALP